MAATEKQWYVGEDGCISIGVPARAVTYHSALNSIIVSTKEPSVKIYDVASGALLQKSNLSGSIHYEQYRIYANCIILKKKSPTDCITIKRG